MTRWRRIALLALVLLVGTVGLAEAQPQSGIVRPTTEPETPSLQLGAELYAGNCASCHGIDGSGISAPRPGAGNVPGAGPSLRGVGAMAADLYLRAGYMPLSSIHDQPGANRVLLSDKEITSLVGYVASLGPGPAIPSPDPAAGNMSEGLQLFTDHCAGCHQVVARGGFVTGAVVPPLQGVKATQIAEAVRTGPYLMPRFSTKQISDAQLNSLIKYVLSTKAPVNHGGWGIGNLGPIPEGLVAWWIAAPLLLIACRVVGRRRRQT
jgi:ubiquinol-cytochrome c reductase cytochrome c subunit